MILRMVITNTAAEQSLTVQIAPQPTAINLLADSDKTQELSSSPTTSAAVYPVVKLLILINGTLQPSHERATSGNHAEFHALYLSRRGYLWGITCWNTAGDMGQTSTRRVDAS